MLSFYKCCGGTVRSRLGLRPACCGTQAYDARFNTCWNGWVSVRSVLRYCTVFSHSIQSLSVKFVILTYKNARNDVCPKLVWGIQLLKLRLQARGLLNKSQLIWGGSAPRSNPLPFICHYSRNRYPFRIPSIDKWYPFHIPCLELCIPFNCCKCTAF